MKSYTSFNERSIATLMGVTYNFKPGIPILVQDNAIKDVNAAGITTTEAYEALMAGEEQPPAPAAQGVPAEIEPVPQAELAVDVEAEDLSAEMAAHAQEARERDEALAAALAAEEAELAAKEAAAEKSPVFDQVVFEAAVREVLKSGTKENLTPKGMPKAAVVADLCGFDVKAIKIVQYCKTLDD